MPTLIHQRVAAARDGRNPTVIARLPSGWVVLGDVQTVPGYCLLLPDPVVPSLNDLDGPGRARFLLDMTLVGDALLEVLGVGVGVGASRINYMILGNRDHALHAHIHPRRSDEPEDLRTRGPWAFGPPREQIPFDLSRDRDLMHRIRQALNPPHEPSRFIG